MSNIESTSQYLRVSVRDKILTIQLNRPERKNALNVEMYLALIKIFAAAGKDESIRVILLKGTEDCFSSGNDLQDFVKMIGSPPQKTVEEDKNVEPATDVGGADTVFEFMHELLHCDKPVVAEVAGRAIGIGATLLLHCDLVYAAKSARLQFPFVPLGLCPEFASSWLLPQLIGHQRATQSLLFGEPIMASQAKEWGLVNEVIDQEQLSESVWDRCLLLTKLPAGAVRSTKQLLKQKVRELAPAVIDNERRYFIEGLQSDDFAKAVAAFQSKRSS